MMLCNACWRFLWSTDDVVERDDVQLSEDCLICGCFLYSIITNAIELLVFLPS